MLKRNREIILWLTDDELEYLKSQARKCGLSQQAFLRSSLKNVPIKEQPSADFHAILSQLEKIGDNINQIAAKANTLNYVDKPEYRKEVDRLERIISELMRAVYN